MRKPEVSTIVIGLIAGVAVAALAIGIATAISARNSANGLKHLTINVCKESSLTARNVEAGLLVLNGAAEIMARSGTDSAELRAYWRANLPALRVALHERQADNAARQKLSDCLRVRDGIVVKLPRGQRHVGKTSGRTSGKTTTNSTPFSGRQDTAGIPPASSEHAPNPPPAAPRPGPTGHRGPAGSPGAPGPASSGNTGSTPAPAPQPSPTPGPGLPSIPIPCVRVPILHPC